VHPSSHAHASVSKVDLGPPQNVRIMRALPAPPPTQHASVAQGTLARRHIAATCDGCPASSSYSLVAKPLPAPPVHTCPQFAAPTSACKSGRTSDYRSLLRPDNPHHAESICDDVQQLMQLRQAGMKVVSVQRAMSPIPPSPQSSLNITLHREDHAVHSQSPQAPASGCSNASCTSPQNCLQTPKSESPRERNVAAIIEVKSHDAVKRERDRPLFSSLIINFVCASIMLVCFLAAAAETLHLVNRPRAIGCSHPSLFLEALFGSNPRCENDHQLAPATVTRSLMECRVSPLLLLSAMIVAVFSVFFGLTKLFLLHVAKCAIDAPYHLASQRCALRPQLCQSTHSVFSGSQSPRSTIKRQALPVLCDRHDDNSSCEGHGISNHRSFFSKVLLTIALIAALVAFRPHVNPIMLDADPIAHCHSLTAPPILELRHDAKSCMPSKTVLALIGEFDPRFNHALTQISRNSASSLFFYLRFLRWLVVITSLGASHIVVLGDSSGLVPLLQHRVGPSAKTGPRRLPCTAIENLRAIDGSFALSHMEFCSSFLRSAVIFCHGRVAPALNAIFFISIVSLIFVVRDFFHRLRRSRLQRNRASMQRLTACAAFALCILTLPLRIEGYPMVRTPEACDALM
jgi:hypothetical protein